MNDPWWDLPGPSAFLDSLEADLREGRSVITALPQHPPSGFRHAVAARVRSYDLWLWREIDLKTETNRARPGEVVRSQLATTCPPTASAIAESHLLGGMVIWISGLDADAWVRWRLFLLEYAHAARAFAPEERGVFCVPLPADIESSLPVDDVALTRRRWYGRVARLDITILVSRILERRSLHPLQRRVAVAVTVEIAGSDSVLARAMASADFTEILDPFTLLADMAARRGWQAGVVQPPRWETGVLDEFDGTAYVHSAALAAAGNREDVQRRVWKGQVSVLFPFIEEQRARILRQLDGHLRVPVKTPFGTITDVRDLEVQHILSQVRRRSRAVGKSTVRLLEHLTEMRHALAHLEPVAHSNLLAREVLDAFR